MECSVVVNKKDFKKQFEERQQQHQLSMLDANRSRAQAVSVGMSGSGTTEITMRGDDGTFLWNVYSPAQVIELIHQLAGNVGCHIHIQPRKDFASWRNWQEVNEEEGFCGQNLEHKKPDLLDRKTNQGMEKDNVATKKAVNRRASKRSRAASK